MIMALQQGADPEAQYSTRSDAIEKTLHEAARRAAAALSSWYGATGNKRFSFTAWLSRNWR